MFGDSMVGGGSLGVESGEPPFPLQPVDDDEGGVSGAGLARGLMMAAVLAGGVGLRRRIADDVEVIAVPSDSVAAQKLELARQEALRVQAEERARSRQREIARMNAVAHGGEREARRRRCQIERGQLKAENGLVR